jgi:putative DNA primase/helicase
MTLGFELVKGVLVPVIADAVGVVAHELMDVVKLSGFECVGRSDAFAQHVRLSNKSDGTIAVERLLSISGEDSLTVDRKYRDPWTGHLPARFLILTNELPRFTDASGALASRFVILVLTETFLGRENPRLSDELLEEAPSIFNWALEGLDRLRARGHFREPTSSVDAMRRLRDLASPVSAFTREACVIGPEHEIDKDELWAAWKNWSENEGMPKSTKALLMRDLCAAFPGIRPKRGQREGDRVQMVVGISLRPAVDQTPDIPDAPPQKPTETYSASGVSGVPSTVDPTGKDPEQEQLDDLGTASLDDLRERFRGL